MPSLSDVILISPECARYIGDHPAAFQQLLVGLKRMSRGYSFCVEILPNWIDVVPLKTGLAYHGLNVVQIPPSMSSGEVFAFVFGSCRGIDLLAAMHAIVSKLVPREEDYMLYLRQLRDLQSLQSELEHKMTSACQPQASERIYSAAIEALELDKPYLLWQPDAKKIVD